MAGRPLSLFGKSCAVLRLRRGKKVIVMGLALSVLMVCWDSLLEAGRDYHYDFINSSLMVTRQEAQRFANHQYLINHQQKCSDEDVLLLLFVKSSPANFDRRKAIRATWGNEMYVETQLGVKTKVLFALGVSPHPHPRRNREVQRQVLRENQRYGDLIQQDFIDTFYNLTIKLLLQIHWKHAHCRHARFLMSADDDIFIHTPNLIRYLQDTARAGARNFWVGRVQYRTAPVRQKESKYYVPPEMYPWPIYPDYTAGAAYVMSGDVASRIYRASLRLNASLHIDDVFMGLCAAAAGVAPRPHYFFSGEGRSPNHTCLHSQMITSHGHVEDVRQLWDEVAAAEAQKQAPGLLGRIYCSLVKLGLLCRPLYNGFSCRMTTLF
ncbi:lactosylceramide 1,3-N-acetyl-beta-D-glucosaminyltransferase B isoform X3 [Denticeps clupeoides]|uniref:lactosylceramide 1,3-N-acetyl-beta-D-glucosaminyltransferase B isoform X3 n=1 Tax=Denticeps clupeoides TaxID=299321 RepID=UPI0010A3EB43|nr:lactosylceramide 1,3-N-acetyl-beta-D-glucosaminyltransferase A-like isoform X3 [Denticeps clupeoides]